MRRRSVRCRCLSPFCRTGHRFASTFGGEKLNWKIKTHSQLYARASRTQLTRRQPFFWLRWRECAACRRWPEMAFDSQRLALRFFWVGELECPFDLFKGLKWALGEFKCAFWRVKRFAEPTPSAWNRFRWVANAWDRSWRNRRAMSAWRFRAPRKQHWIFDSLGVACSWLAADNWQHTVQRIIINIPSERNK